MFDFRCSSASRLLRLMILLSVMLASLPVRAARAEASASSVAFTVPKAVVDESVWKAIWRNRYDRTYGVEMSLYSAFLAQLYKNDPALEAGQAVGQINALRQQYEAAGQRQGTAYDEIVRAMFDAALGLPHLTATVKGTWAVFVDQGIFPQLDSATTIAAMTRRFELADSWREREDKVLQTVLDLARQNARFADAYDQLTGTALNASVKNLDAKTLMAAHPALYVPPRIRDTLLPDGTLSISLDELKGLSRTEFDKLTNSLINLRSAINTVDANQQILLDYVKDEQKKAETQAQAKVKADEEKLALDARKSAFSILSTLVGLQDEKLGKTLSTVFNSGVEIGDALTTWLGAIAKLEGLDTLTNMSTLVMTGNVLGAVMNIVNLFSSSGPSPDQQILEAIGKLRQQIDDLRKDMHSRFDRIDRQLNTIYTTMQERFNLIDLQLGKINGNVQEIQRTLIGIDLALSRIERNNYEFLDAAHRRPLLNGINGAIGYQARTGTAMPYQPDFVDTENVFQSWGTLHAFDALSAGPAQRDFSDGQVLAELNAYPLDANINYLNGWLVAHGLAPFASERLPSARDWTFASRAYAQLALDWPAHIQRISPERQAALDAVGGNLAAATRRISTLDTPSGPQGNTPLFTAVISNYQGKLAQLDQALLTQSTHFNQELQVTRLQRDTPFDLWGGMDQELTYESPEFGRMTCGVAATLGYSSTHALKYAVPNINRYMLAEYLKLGTIKNCVTADWVDTTEQTPCNPKLGCQEVARFQIAIDVKFNNGFGDVSVERRVLKYDNYEVPDSDPQTLLNSRWRNPAVRTKFSTDSVREKPSDVLKAQRLAVLDKATSDLQTRLAEYQREVYGLLYNELSAGSLRPVAVALGGAKALLDSFITLGLPNAVANDDLLRSLLFGTQRLHDDSLAADTYALSMAQPITQVQIMTDTRVALNQLATQRVAALDELLDGYLDAIGNNTHAETFGLIADARMELRLSQRLATLGGATTQTQVFLPMVRK